MAGAGEFRLYYKAVRSRIRVAGLRCLAEGPLTLPLLLGRLPELGHLEEEDKAAARVGGMLQGLKEDLVDLFVDFVGARVGELYDVIGEELEPRRR